MMFFDGYIGAPPTLTVASADAGIMVAVEVNASAATAAAANRLRRLDIMFSLRGWKQAATPPVGRRRSRRRPPSFAADRSHFVVAQSYGSFARRFRNARDLTPS